MVDQPYRDLSLPPIGKPPILHPSACPLCGALVTDPKADLSMLVAQSVVGPPRVELVQGPPKPVAPADPFAEPWGPPATTITLPDDLALPPPANYATARNHTQPGLVVPELTASRELQIPGIATTRPVTGQPRFIPQPPAQLQGPTENDPQIFAHPLVGRWTIFVLLYGQYPELHRQCLQALIGTMPPGQMELRLISNELCDETLKYIEELSAAGLVATHYRNQENRKKYPAMRAAFHDPTRPITAGRWVLWFDDDSFCRDPMWAYHLARFMSRHPNAGMIGCRFVSQIQSTQARWIRSRPWYRGKLFRTSHGQPAANGDKILFAAGGWWAILTEAIKKAQIPDAELGHNLGDITIGEQVYQNGYDVLDWNRGKEFVHTSGHQRRGITDSPPWAK